MAFVQASSSPSNSSEVFLNSNTSELQSNDSEDYSSLHELIFQLNAAMNGLSFLATILNIAILIILSLYSCKQSRTTAGARLISTTHLLISLASGDLLMAICSQVHSIFILIAIPSDHQTLVYADASNLCTIRLLGAFENIAIPITLMNLFLLALDHAVAVFCPLEYHLGRYQTLFSVLISCSWIAATLLGFLDLILDATKHQVTCETINDQQTIDHYIHIILVFIVLVTNAIIYATILIYIRRVLNATYRTNVPSARSLRQRLKSLATTLLLLGTYIICWLPYHTIALTEVFQIEIPHLDNPRTAFTLDFALHLFILINAILDPLIYAIRIKDVRASIRRIFKWQSIQYCCYSRSAMAMALNGATNECQQSVDATSDNHQVPFAHCHHSASFSATGNDKNYSTSPPHLHYTNSQFNTPFNEEDEDDQRDDYPHTRNRHRSHGPRVQPIPIEMEMERFLSSKTIPAAVATATTAAVSINTSFSELHQDVDSSDHELINNSSVNTSQS